MFSTSLSALFAAQWMTNVARELLAMASDEPRWFDMMIPMHMHN
jgi:hypothetical protein